MARVVIIGGGPAGSSAGMHLAERGFGVTIVEAKAFPRVKVCGEFISPSATAMLERMVGAGSLLKAGARRVDTLVLERAEREVTWQMPSPAWAISRASLDAMLLGRAKEAGCSVLQPCRVDGMEYHDDGVQVRPADGRVFGADLVVHADGSGRWDTGAARATPCRPGVVAHKCHLRIPGGVAGVRMRAANGAYVGTVQVEHGLATCAMVARRELIRAHGGDTDSLLRSLWERYDPAWRVGPWLACGVAESGYTRPVHVRSFRVGNAAATVEPVGGEGIGLALWSGVRLAELLDKPDACQQNRQLAAAQRRFARDYRQRLRLRRPSCRLAASALSNPWLTTALWPLVGTPSLSIRPWYALTGKPLAAR